MRGLIVNSTLFLALWVAISAHAGETIRFQRGSLRPEAGTKIAATTETQDWILQFQKAPTWQEQVQLQRQQLQILGYLPDDALVVRGSQGQILAAKMKNANVRALMAYPAGMKLAANLPALSIFSRTRVQRYLIKAFLPADLVPISQEIERRGLGLIQQADGNSLVVEAIEANLLKLAEIQGVEHIQEPTRWQTMDFKDLDSKSEDVNDPVNPEGGDFTDLTGMESGTKLMNFAKAWELGFEGQGQIASMADTGLDSGDKGSIHQDFSGSVVEGQIFGLYSKSWGDPMGHGTHVAGSIVGRGTASPISATSSWHTLRGGAPAAQFVGQSMWSPMLSNLMVPSQLGGMFGKAYEKGARIHSNSWGAANNLGAYDTYAFQVDEFMFANQDMLILFAAGNSGADKNKDGRIDPGSVSSPGTAKNALTVGASENLVFVGGLQKKVSEFRQAKDEWPAEPIWSSKVSDNAQGLAMFSSRGPTSDGRLKPEIVAPGTNILSVRSQDPKAEPLWGIYNKDYVWSGGTSMSTPLTAGAATVARQILQEKYAVANPSAALVKALLMNTAFDLYPGQYGEGGLSQGQEIIQRRPNSDEGYGRVDMQNLVTRTLQVWDEKIGVLQGENKIYEIEVISTVKAVITLVYTDAPGSINAAQALVNDLDVSLIASDGTVKAEPKDRINNHEIIEMTLAPGKYQIRVNGAKIPLGRDGRQPFALIMSSI